MGKKISIDSATMMNKIFEVIEAKKIFNLGIDKFNIIIHPKSYIHAIVNFKNGLIKILVHDTNMEIPIINSINYNKEIFEYNNKDINFNKLNGINFLNPDIKKYPSLKLLKLIPKKFSYFETILITLNDELVKNYLKNKISYFSIIKILMKMIKTPYFCKFYHYSPNSINDIKSMVGKVKSYLNIYLKKYENYSE